MFWVASGLVAVTAVLTGWAVLARIPETTTGLGTLTPIDSVFSISANGSGTVLYPIRWVKDQYRYSPPAWSKQAFDYLENPRSVSDEDLYRLIQSVLESITVYDTERFPVDSANRGLKRDGENYTLDFAANDVIVIIENSAARTKLQGALLALTESIELLQAVQSSQKESTEYGQATLDEQADLLKRLQKVYEQGAINREQFLQSKSSLSASKSNQASQISQLNKIKTEISQNKIELKNVFSDYLRSSVVFANDPGRVDALIAPQWSEVQPGAEVMTISWSQKLKPNTIPVFVDQRSASMISLGNQIIATPSGFSAAEVGGIKGRVSSIDAQPLSVAQLTKRLGSEGLASTVASGGAYQVFVQLQRVVNTSSSREEVGSNRGGYVWNNRSNPPVPPREGMLMQVQFTTRYRTPLEMLIPAVKEFMGLEEPARFRNLQAGGGQ
ncbi:hypothetical protein CB0101_10825 [Synechococcus sp. CB0101]|uniref:hypothetical protein n=1 Tax=Synechococcus sp. CB0101 TaxID=232348 RepID=UPI0010A9F861|nr:hypothetical protein [Synechococcus sp. CB0101]QCH15360.1 hypothetical protein CB0101_10825 [Synechococcus sp. CB0101]